MKKIYIACLVFCLTFFTTQKTSAQVTSYNFFGAPETYQTVSGTVVSFINEDDTYHPNLPIGFTFVYNGNSTDRFGVCTNGFICLDSLFHSGIWTPNPGTVNCVSPFMADLYISWSGATIEYVTTGTAPNRQLFVQWKNVSFYPTGNCNINFQVILFETTNCIKFVYGSCGCTQPVARDCYVGLIGNSLSDFNTRTSIVNDWAQTFQSSSLNNNWLTFNSTSILTAGLAYYFGCFSAASTPYSFFTGSVFNDINNNGIKDAGENGFQNHIIRETLHNIYASTDSLGNYAMFFPDSSIAYNLTLTSTLCPYSVVSNVPPNHNVIPLSQSCSNLDFGLYLTPNVHDVQTGVSMNLRAVPGLNTQPILASYNNIGTVIENGMVQLVMNNLFSFVSSVPAPDAVSGDTVTWNYSNLQLLESRNIMLILHTDSSAQIGDTLDNEWSVTPLITDAAPGNNIYYAHHRVTTSFDPNQKSVSPAGNIPNGTTLHYTIHFQNTGTSPAMNVMILDTLDANLDRNSFVIEGSSHPLSFWTMTGSGNLRFVFQNIMLPDSNSNEPESHGYINFRINPLPSLSFNTVISNAAHIFFDYNPAILTNTTTSTITELVTSAEDNSNSASLSLLVYPNPFSQSAVLMFEMQAGKNYSLEIVSPDGKLIRNIENVSSGKVVIDRKNISSGIYFVRLRSGNEIKATGKLLAE